jgi:trypsin-like peptidase
MLDARSYGCEMTSPSPSPSPLRPAPVRGAPRAALPPVESILLSAAPVVTFDGLKPLTNASGFFFERDERLFLVTSRHVMIDAPSKHFPNRIEIELHDDPANIASTTGFSIPLYQEGQSVWRQGIDSAGEIDVAAIEIERSALPDSVVFRSFTPLHLIGPQDTVEIGAAVLILGFPLGFYDQLHRVPVVRQAVVASSLALRFQGEGYFLTDARTHRGSSGAPVIIRIAQPDAAHRELPWMLLGVHSARLDVGSREEKADEALGLNCAWFADILLALTKD